MVKIHHVLESFFIKFLDSKLFGYFFEDFADYAINSERIKESHMTVNYNFLVKLYNELTQDQKIKFSKNLQVTQIGISKTG